MGNYHQVRLQCKIRPRDMLRARQCVEGPFHFGSVLEPLAYSMSKKIVVINRGQFNQPFGANRKCVSSHSALSAVLGHSVSPTKLCPTLPVNTIITPNFYTLYTQYTVLQKDQSKIQNLLAKKLFVECWWNWPLLIFAGYWSKNLRAKTEFYNTIIC